MEDEDTEAIGERTHSFSGPTQYGKSVKEEDIDINFANSISMGKYLYFLKSDIAKGVIAGYPTQNYYSIEDDINLAILNIYQKIKKVITLPYSQMYDLTLNEINILMEKALREIELENKRKLSELPSHLRSSFSSEEKSEDSGETAAVSQ